MRIARNGNSQFSSLLNIAGKRIDLKRGFAEVGPAYEKYVEFRYIYAGVKASE